MPGSPAIYAAGAGASVPGACGGRHSAASVPDSGEQPYLKSTTPTAVGTRYPGRHPPAEAGCDPSGPQTVPCSRDAAPWARRPATQLQPAGACQGTSGPGLRTAGWWKNEPTRSSGAPQRRTVHTIRGLWPRAGRAVLPPADACTRLQHGVRARGGPGTFLRRVPATSPPSQLHRQHYYLWVVPHVPLCDWLGGRWHGWRGILVGASMQGT